MYGCQVNAFVEAAVATVSTETSVSNNASMQRSLKSFLHRIYYDLRNLGHATKSISNAYDAPMRSTIQPTKYMFSTNINQLFLVCGSV